MKGPHILLFLFFSIFFLQFAMSDALQPIRVSPRPPSFSINFFPNEGLGDGFTIPHPYYDGMITVHTIPKTAAGIAGATPDDRVWIISLRFNPALADSDSESTAKITDASSLQTRAQLLHLTRHVQSSTEIVHP